MEIKLIAFFTLIMMVFFHTRFDAADFRFRRTNPSKKEDFIGWSWVFFGCIIVASGLTFKEGQWLNPISLIGIIPLRYGVKKLDKNMYLDLYEYRGENNE